MTDLESYLTAVDRDAGLLATAAGAAGDDARVPACPDWTVRDLVLHQGQVHRWATAHVTGQAERILPFPPAPDLAGAELLAWLLAGAAELVAALGDAPADLRGTTFLPTGAPPLAFWARRQAHETAMHRVDAEQAAGRAVTPFEPSFAADGVDELLLGFLSRRRNAVRADEPRTVGVHAEDTDTRWTLSIGPDGSKGAATTDLSSADCVLRGAAPDLYLALWNRADLTALTVSGDASLADDWRTRALVT